MTTTGDSAPASNADASVMSVAIRTPMDPSDGVGCVSPPAAGHQHFFTDRRSEPSATFVDQVDLEPERAVPVRDPDQNLGQPRFTTWNVARQRRHRPVEFRGQAAGVDQSRRYANLDAGGVRPGDGQGPGVR